MSADLTDMLALVTGGRLKIGYYTSLKLLQCGATVIVTTRYISFSVQFLITRFPIDAALRYQKEPDYKQWAGRLHVYGLDMRHLPSLLEFIEHIKTAYKRIDILINNAAQTIRRPSAFYEHLMETEKLAAPGTKIECYFNSF
jgi:NAD(P)-dependent dehydrogenase (short-subunit alcohol dehydrogenase family)